MKFTIAPMLVALVSVSAAAVENRNQLVLPRQAQAPVGACCTPNVSLKQDVCIDATGVVGKCVPANSAGCNAALTCIANNKLQCDNTKTENGKPFCRASPHTGANAPAPAPGCAV